MSKKQEKEGKKSKIQMTFGKMFAHRENHHDDEKKETKFLVTMRRGRDIC